MNRYRFCLLIFLIPLISATCKSTKKSADPKIEQVSLDSAAMKMIIEAIHKSKKSEDDGRPYEASATKTWALQHTALTLDFDYEKAWVMGLADISLKPYAYPQDSLVIDAKGMDLEVVRFRRNKETYIPEFHYDKKQIVIYLHDKIEVDTIIHIVIKYIAKPDEIVTEGNNAIATDKGLYFVNKDRKDPDKPRQIWTQGEMETNSCWFPTIDKPNQKMTQEIILHIKDSNDISLSNGTMFTSRAKDGSHWDVWRQTQPAAPYLTMIAVGPFKKTRDKWRDMEVSYYMEEKYSPYARLIFGKTPAMIEFFSQRLGVDYPWGKYSQIVVRDYTGGSMENTTATLHWDKLQHDARSHIDNDYEEYISHELFHQWFGDLVTCESWSNLPMNESFATYGEYLWLEYSKGKMEADMHYDEDRVKYFNEATTKREPLIRFHYNNKDDMFDAHSYQKGSCILHMLRNYLGDTVFFRGLKKYLVANSYKPVEAHNLRLVMEEVSGRDLNWFFNQWFFREGHPKVGIGRNYEPNKKIQNLTIDFLDQDEKNAVRYTLPVKVDFYFKDSIHHETLLIKDLRNSWNFPFEEQPLLINVDADRIILWETDYRKANEELKYQLIHAPLYLDKKEAVRSILEKDKKHDPFTVNEKYSVIDYCFNHEFRGIRELGFEVLATMGTNASAYKAKVTEMIMREKNSAFRVELLHLLRSMATDEEMIPVLRSCCNDSSYIVMSNALYLLAKADKMAALQVCKANENVEDITVVRTIISIYTTDKEYDNSAYLVHALSIAKSYDKTIRLTDIEKYIKQATLEYAYETLKLLDQNRATLFKGYDGYFFINLRMYFNDEKAKHADFMSRARYDEAGYKAAQARLEMYDKILALLNN